MGFHYLSAIRRTGVKSQGENYMAIKDLPGERPFIGVRLTCRPT